MINKKLVRSIFYCFYSIFFMGGGFSSEVQDQNQNVKRSNFSKTFQMHNTDPNSGYVYLTNFVKSKDCLDLHGVKSAKHAKDVFYKFMEQTISQGISTVEVITGRGKHVTHGKTPGVLAASLPSWIKKHKSLPSIIQNIILAEHGGSYTLLMRKDNIKSLINNKFNFMQSNNVLNISAVFSSHHKMNFESKHRQPKVDRKAIKDKNRKLHEEERNERSLAERVLSRNEAKYKSKTFFSCIRNRKRRNVTHSAIYAVASGKKVIEHIKQPLVDPLCFSEILGEQWHRSKGKIATAYSVSGACFPGTSNNINEKAKRNENSSPIYLYQFFPLKFHPLPLVLAKNSKSILKNKYTSKK